MGFAGYAAVAAVTAATSIYTGSQQSKAARKSRNQQDVAQRQALSSATSERKRAGEAERRINARTPDTAALLAAAQQDGSAGIGSTFLSKKKRNASQPTTLLGDVGDAGN